MLLVLNSMHWGVACITARADVFTMMIGSLTRDQIRKGSPDYIHGIDEANVQSELKNVSSNVGRWSRSR